MKTGITINPILITWAITRAGFDLNTFLDNNPTIQKWIDNVKKPTVKQLENFANKCIFLLAICFFQNHLKKRFPSLFLEQEINKPIK